jgi:hypothetical protein
MERRLGLSTELKGVGKAAEGSGIAVRDSLTAIPYRGPLRSETLDRLKLALA